MIIRPFRALRPDPRVAAEVAAVPYDVVSRDEAAKLAEGHPLSFLHVSRPEIDLPAGTNPYSDEVYARAKSNLDALTRQAPLIRDPKPELYVYRLTLQKRSQTGIVGTFSIDEYDSGLIRKHERTRKDKEDDRTRQVVSVSAQTGPVFLTYRDVAEVDAAIAHTISEKPMYDFVAPDGVRHEAWVARGSAALVQHFSRRVPALYIADGHHRAAAASRARVEVAGSESDFFLAVAFPASQLRILPYYRVVKDLAGLNRDQFLSRLDEAFVVTRARALNPPQGEFGMCLQQASGPEWFGLKPKQARRELDVTVLQETLLAPLLKIQDARTDTRIDFVGGIRGPGELEQRVRDGSAAVAFSLHPTRIEQVMEISDGGGIMPPKSTWFEPKLRDGLFSHLIHN
jgi:uncharacterized protein (DUF1015 family)